MAKLRKKSQRKSRRKRPNNPCGRRGKYKSGPKKVVANQRRNLDLDVVSQ